MVQPDTPKPGIARIWRGRTTRDKADAYAVYLYEHGIRPLEEKALGVHLLRPGGQLLAITPRSFTNGPYFRLFRQYFLERMRLDRVHVFEARNKVFADSAVLQENVILVATRTVSAERGPVVVSTSKSHSDEIWCADNPTHLIHFNGERFLGSYH